MFKRFLFVLCVLAQSAPVASSAPRPKLVVVISVDQFRFDYLTKFQQYFGNGGIRLLLERGASFANATYKHALNLTGPSHAAISTGSYGDQNGIFANSWYDWRKGKELHCVDDPGVKPVGASTGGASPSLLLSTTIGDEMRTASDFHSKVISVSIKDRTAILMGGKSASGVYWLVDSQFVSSTYYMKDLPQWVDDFNGSGIVNSYYGKRWTKTLPEASYAMMDNDDVPYEENEDRLGRAFPHRITGTDTTTIHHSYYSALSTSPFGNEILCHLAMKAIVAESLGKRDATDLLCIGFSSNDYVGHRFGPNSQEVLDMTVRTDSVFADLFGFIDSEVGLSNCIIVFTSDHGVAPIPEYLLAHQPNMSAGRVSGESLLNWADGLLTRSFGKTEQGMKWIDFLAQGNLYLDHETISRKAINLYQVINLLADSLRMRPELAAVLTREEMLGSRTTSPVEEKMKRSFYRDRSGDILYALKPFYIEQGGHTGTTHGQPYDYDAHVPLMFFGNRIRPGTYFSEASPVDIAPTLAVLLGINFPTGREGKVLREMIRE
jgi:predicted AlkP superfamily pyrophosphatase or phosphodiesterase